MNNGKTRHIRTPRDLVRHLRDCENVSMPGHKRANWAAYAISQEAMDGLGLVHDEMLGGWNHDTAGTHDCPACNAVFNSKEN